MLNLFARARLATVLDPVGRFFVRRGVSPDVITVLGTAGVLIGAFVFVATGRILVGTIVITCCVLTDMVDGAIARARGGGSKWGAFLDSTMDRIADGAVFGSLAFWLGSQDRPVALAGALVCLVAGFVVSYARARAESLGFTCSGGIAERTERLIIVGIAAILTVIGVPLAFEVVLWALACLSLFTIGQRMWAVRAQAITE